MTGPTIPDNLTPYAGGETRPNGGGGSSSARKERIPGDDLNNPPSARGCASPRADIEPYAAKLGADSAERDGGEEQTGDANTARGTHNGPVIDTAREGPGSADGSLDRPLSPDPYANTTTTSADRCDAAGL